MLALPAVAEGWLRLLLLCSGIVFCVFIFWYLDSVRLVYEQDRILKDRDGRLVELHRDIGKQAEKHQAEKLDMMRRLLAVLSHELKNPLSSIKNISYYLQETKKDADKTTVSMIELLASEADRMNDILNDYRESLRKGEKSLVRVDEIASSLVWEFSQKHAWQIQMQLENAEMHADPAAIKHLLFHLLKNACKAVEGKGAVTLAIRKKEDSLQLIVEDSGCGMDKKVQERIFEPLYTTHAKGLGLGLTLVKDIVERHQGTIEVQSEKGKGSTFLVSLPATPR